MGSVILKIETSISVQEWMFSKFKDRKIYSETHSVVIITSAGTVCSKLGSLIKFYFLTILVTLKIEYRLSRCYGAYAAWQTTISDYENS